MGLPVEIRGKNGTGGVAAEVTTRGQLITAPISYSSSFVATANVDDTAFNLVFPKAERVFVITGAIITGTKSISAVTDATVIVYEASSDTSITVANTLIELALPRSEIIPLTDLNIITEIEGSYINIKTSDETVVCTLLGYYIGHHHEI